MVNNEEIMKIKDELNKEFFEGLSYTQIQNIDYVLEDYLKKREPNNEYKLLLYSSRIKNIINNYRDKLNQFELKKIEYLCTVEYVVNRAISNVYDNASLVSRANNKDVENSIEKIEDEILNDNELMHYKKKRRLINKNNQ